MDLITKGIQRAFTYKCVAEVREDLETDKEQISNPVTVDTSKVLYEKNLYEEIIYIFNFVIKDITNSILKEKPLLEWSHSENNYYKRLGENVAGCILDRLCKYQTPRSHINALVKSVPMVEFSK